MMRIAAWLVVSLCMLLAACAGSRPTAAEATPAAPTPIRTPQALQRHLAQELGHGSPLDAFPVGARTRFLRSLSFGRGGVAGFDVADLEESLSTEQAAAVLGLFGLDDYLAALQPLPQPRPARNFETPFERRYLTFHEAIDGQPQAATQALADLLERESAATVALRLDTCERLLLLRALLVALRQESTPARATEVIAALDLLDREQAAQPRQIQRVYQALISARDFDAAARLRQRFPSRGLEPLPARDFEDTLDPLPESVLEVSADALQMSRRRIDLDQGLRIVVVAGCHFARDAARAIATDPALDRLFRRHGVWLASQSESFTAVADWNREFPTQPMHIAWRDRDWPRVRSWAMPAFHVFRDGQLVAQWNGWPADSGMATLREQLRAAGVGGLP
ncbi:MAG: hypothetical protein IPG63_02230 [Xanthomonadales bacterium]|nr:hypothetical protein [Xanthomonadales bacterium]